MNYISQLRLENKKLKTELEYLKSGLSDLRSYLNSPKFSCGDRLDGYVQIQDIFLRLREAEQSGLDRAAEVTLEPEGSLTNSAKSNNL